MTHDPAVAGFLAGAISAGFVGVALYFLRFWRKTGDVLFASFAAAFLLLAVGQAILVLVNIPSEAISRVYLLRLLAFLLIISAIVRKNLKSR